MVPLCEKTGFGACEQQKDIEVTMTPGDKSLITACHESLALQIVKRKRWQGKLVETTQIDCSLSATRGLDIEGRNSVQ